MKEKVLDELKSHELQYISGEDLGRLLGVSRTAIWKHIKTLRNEGYVIEASSKKGYRIVSTSDMMNAHEINYQLKTEVIGKKIVYFDAIDSTSSYAKKMALEGCDDGTVVIADFQTNGRGRLGRQWDSTHGKGIWMSVILKPLIGPEEVQTITLAASVAVVAALKKSTGIETKIKWPNDIILADKKVCGILAEMNSEMERINFLVLGIGINVNQERGDFAESLNDLAISLKIYSNRAVMDENQLYLETDFNRIEIIKNVLYELDRIYSKINKGFASDILDEWRKYSLTLCKEVRVISKNSEYVGMAKDITKDGKLVVLCADGELREVISGEVSVRGVLGHV